MFLFFKFHFHLFHLFGHAFVRRNFAGLEKHTDAEDEEEGGGEEVGDLFGDEGGDRMTEDGGENGHDEEGGVGGGEDKDAVVAHGHQAGDEEGLVANF